MTDPVPSKELTWKPCPFCGGTDIRHDRHHRAGDRMHGYADVFSMCCYACGAQFPNCYSLRRLNEQWNARAAPEPATGPGTLEYRFSRLIAELERRFGVEPQPFSSEAPEARIMAALDRPAQPPLSPSAILDAAERAMDRGELIQPAVERILGAAQPPRDGQ